MPATGLTPVLLRETDCPGPQSPSGPPAAGIPDPLAGYGPAQTTPTHPPANPCPCASKLVVHHAPNPTVAVRSSREIYHATPAHHPYCAGNLLPVPDVSHPNAPPDRPPSTPSQSPVCPPEMNSVNGPGKPDEASTLLSTSPIPRHDASRDALPHSDPTHPLPARAIAAAPPFLPSTHRRNRPIDPPLPRAPSALAAERSSAPQPDLSAMPTAASRQTFLLLKTSTAAAPNAMPSLYQSQTTQKTNQPSSILEANERTANRLATQPSIG